MKNRPTHEAGESVTCPYCKHQFPAKYYDNWHVPCPEPKGDKET